MSILKVQQLNISFGGLKALSNFSFNVQEKSIHAIIGPNGAGKTTAFNIIAGHLKPSSGNIEFQGKNITGYKPHKVAKQGIYRTFQGISIFDNMSVLENVMVGLHLKSRSGVFASSLLPPLLRKDEKWIKEEAEKWLSFFGLTDKAKLNPSSLPFGTRRMLELARALAGEPKLLLLDEPASGLNTGETSELASIIIKIKEEMGITVLLVEHDMWLVMDIADHISVLNQGEKIAEGKPKEIHKNPEVIRVYLGGEI